VSLQHYPSAPSSLNDRAALILETCTSDRTDLQRQNTDLWVIEGKTVLHRNPSEGVHSIPISECQYILWNFQYAVCVCV
jgi:hypothetical protein